MTRRVSPAVQVVADQMRAAHTEGKRHALKTGSRSKNPYFNVDEDLRRCWDEGWIVGSELLDERDRGAAA